MMDCDRAGRRRRRADSRRRSRAAERLPTKSDGAFPALVALYDNTASLQDRTVGTGVAAPELARQFGAGGYVGRASRPHLRCAPALPGYAPYGELKFEVPVLARMATSMRASGCASARSSKACR